MVEWDQVTENLTQAWTQVGRGLTRVFGNRNERIVRAAEPLVAEINARESWAQSLTQEQMIAKTAEWKNAVQKEGKPLLELLPEAFAMVREAGLRALNMRHFDVQLVGGIVLHQGKIAEMATGEGRRWSPRFLAFERARRQGRIRGDRQRLPRQARPRLDGADLRICGIEGGGDPAVDVAGGAQARIRVRHHLWHEQRVRLRLPARQHEVDAGGPGPTQPQLCDRRRGRLRS